MRRRRYGYNQVYRGRREGSAFLKGLVIVLAVLLVLGLLFLLFISPQFLEYTDEGTRLNLPWLQEPTEAPTLTDVPDVIVSDAPEPEESATPEPVSRVLHALEVSPAAVTAGSAETLAAQAGADALLVQVKDEEGNLAWYSELSLAQEDMQGDAGFSEAVRELARSDGLYLTARLTGFQDLWTSVYVRELAIVYPSGRLWYDNAGISWISLSHEDARSYITNLCLELAALGFDEILLEHAAYPDNGRVSGIQTNDNYPGTGRDILAAAYLEELSQALEEAGAVLSVQSVDLEPDASAVSGLTPAALTGVSGRIWLPEGADMAAWVEALRLAGMEDPESRLVAIEPLAEGTDWTGSRLLSGG